MAFFRPLALLFAGAVLASVVASAQNSAPAPAAPDKRAVMSGDQVIRILDETVDWYRTLGAQQQSATQPSDLLILYANRQIAEKVINLAFEIARANAELLSSDAEQAQKARVESESSQQAMQQVQKKLDARRIELEQEIAVRKKEAASAPKGGPVTEAQSRVAELQSELDLTNARRNLLGTVAQFTYQSDANGSGVSALKQHIDAIAASIPSASGTTPADGATGAGSAANAAKAAPLITATEEASQSGGIWELGARVLRLSTKMSTITTIDERTAALQDTFTEIRARPQEQIRALSARGDSLSDEADSAGGTALRGVRDQFDTLAWLFRQTASILVPLSQEGVLLDQYRRNLTSWRENTRAQYVEALKALGLRLLILIAMLIVVFAAGEAWRRGVVRYVHEPRRRSQLLLIRRIVLLIAVVAIIGFTLISEVGSLATFAGLITAGVAVAMQSVLVSIVGYFFLIGKYGIRVGDRVQIGTVTGEVIDLGLVRLHLMELRGDGPLGPTGRVVAFANSVVFQASGGIFKQIPGVNLAWHEITLTLPADADFTALKEKLLACTNHVLTDYRADIDRQTKEIQRASSSHSLSEAQAQVQLKFSAANVDATVRYPVQLSRAAEIDERISRELLAVIREPAKALPPPSPSPA